MAREFPPKVRAAILARDGGCIGPRIGMPDPCFGRLEVDHVHNGGLGRKGDPVESNGATFCLWHHDHKTRGARRWRVAIDAWIASHSIGMGFG